MAKLNKKDVAYTLAINYSGNTKPKITKFNKKNMVVYYGYKVDPDDVIKSLKQLEPSLKIKHKAWNSISSGGGTHTFLFEAATPEDDPEYFKGLSKDDKEERERVIAKRSKMDDDDPDAYKDFKSDKGVKTKVSKHTNKFKQMYGESGWKAIKETYKMSKGLNEMSAAVKKGLRKKAEKSGMPFGILKQVFNRGMAAWKTGHRPGASQQQWGYARVNSFTTKSPGTWGKADKDLAKKVRGKK